VLGGVQCDICKSSYNVSDISYLNSPPTPFIPPPKSAHVDVLHSNLKIQNCSGLP
jgi:hypothetical protein